MYFLSLSVLVMAVYQPCYIDGAAFGMFGRHQFVEDPCYDAEGRPVRCVANFINAAFGKPVIASNTCGMRQANRFCVVKQSVDRRLVETCDVCDSRIEGKEHPASLLTDHNNPHNLTCWISEPVPDEQTNVTLTLSLGKKYELTYVSLQFCNQRPDSMAIEKSSDFGKSWQPFQYYSSECERIYKKQPNIPISKHNEQEALCTDAHSRDDRRSDRIAFATLEGRPSGFDFEHSPVLQDWVTATDIRVTFNRMSLHQSSGLYNNAIESSAELMGNNITSSEQSTSQVVPEHFFYSMADLAVGGRCKCNGHAAQCILDKNGKYACDCKHNTAGQDCEKCKPFHYDRPWGRAVATDAHECVR